jgi:hypothetical protein
MTWELIWKLVFIIVLSTFGVMSIVVTILGARDIKRLLRHLRDQDQEK